MIHFEHVPTFVTFIRPWLESFLATKSLYFD